MKEGNESVLGELTSNTNKELVNKYHDHKIEHMVHVFLVNNDLDGYCILINQIILDLFLLIPFLIFYNICVYIFKLFI